MLPPEIVVGTDDSPSSRQAVGFAAAQAQARSCGLRIVHAYDWRVVGARAQVGGAYADDARGHAENVVAAAIEEVRAANPGLAVRGETVLGPATPALIAASRTAELLVVGSRGRGGFGSLLLGSVSQQVATHATAPVAAVRGHLDTGHGPVVVGVDGSDGADHALGLAFAEAQRHGRRLVAVHAYVPARPPWGLDAPPVVEDPVERRDSERETLQHIVLPWSDKYPAVEVDTVAVAGDPADVLVRMSDGAFLTVVGSRGRGGFAALVLGSVGLQLLHHAACPVVIDRAASPVM